MSGKAPRGKTPNNQFEQVLGIKKEDLGNEHESTLYTEALFSGLYDRLGKYEQSRLLWKRIVEKSEETLGANDEATLLYIGGLAGALYSLGRFSEAEDLFRKQLSGFPKAPQMGYNHPYISHCLNDLEVTL